MHSSYHPARRSLILVVRYMRFFLISLMLLMLCGCATYLQQSSAVKSVQGTEHRRVNWSRKDKNDKREFDKKMIYNDLWACARQLPEELPVRDTGFMTIEQVLMFECMDKLGWDALVITKSY